MQETEIAQRKDYTKPAVLSKKSRDNYIAETGRLAINRHNLSTGLVTAVFSLIEKKSTTRVKKLGENIRRNHRILTLTNSILFFWFQTSAQSFMIH